MASAVTPDEAKAHEPLAAVDEPLNSAVATPARWFDGTPCAPLLPYCAKTLTRPISGPLLLSKDKGSVIMAFSLSLAAMHEVRAPTLYRPILVAI
jgi:hypothetical protein